MFDSKSKAPEPRSSVAQVNSGRIELEVRACAYNRQKLAAIMDHAASVTTAATKHNRGSTRVIILTEIFNDDNRHVSVRRIPGWTKRGRQPPGRTGQTNFPRWITYWTHRQQAYRQRAHRQRTPIEYSRIQLASWRLQQICITLFVHFVRQVFSKNPKTT